MNNLQYLKPSLQRRQKRRDKRLDEELIECYRIGARFKEMKGYKNKLKRNVYEHAPMQESMKYKHRGATRDFNDNLEPLKRLLNSSVGKNWNKVHAKLCAQVGKRSVSGQHIFNHLYHFVCEQTFTVEGKIYYMPYGRYQELAGTEKWPKFYINAKTGQLMKAKSMNKKQQWK